MADRHAPRPTVQLWHELPDGTGHVDWMLAKSAAEDPDDAQRLITFRLPARIDETAPGGRLEAERIDDHRRAYLTYEGEISGDRGVVRRLASGEIIDRNEYDDRWLLTIAWNRPEGRQIQRLRLQPVGDPFWTVCVIRPHTSDMRM